MAAVDDNAAALENAGTGGRRRATKAQRHVATIVETVRHRMSERSLLSNSLFCNDTMAVSGGGKCIVSADSPSRPLGISQASSDAHHTNPCTDASSGSQGDSDPPLPICPPPILGSCSSIRLLYWPKHILCNVFVLGVSNVDVSAPDVDVYVDYVDAHRTSPTVGVDVLSARSLCTHQVLSGSDVRCSRRGMNSAHKASTTRLASSRGSSEP